ncbi:GNAT family N-acetyltransferase [Caulobacter segnis]
MTLSIRPSTDAEHTGDHRHLRLERPETAWARSRKSRRTRPRWPAAARVFLDRSLPYLVAELDGAVVGYCYAGPFRLRAAYRYTVEDSVYVSPAAVGQGVGKALLGELIRQCEALGLRRDMRGDRRQRQRRRSIGLHAAMGFTKQGVFPGMGYKFGRWVDLVWMQRPLNGGTATPPDAPGMSLDRRVKVSSSRNKGLTTLPPDYGLRRSGAGLDGFEDRRTEAIQARAGPGLRADRARLPDSPRRSVTS